ncbi:MAG TPA: response regulator, partial [Bdellovibrionales bacterium]|nr:response regulator [Bdellovibrionales bacterium]
KALRPVFGEAVFTVADTGIGIPSDRLITIFEKFVQADSSVTRRYGGTGLGLAISKSLAEAMGGKIQVESKIGVGSRFTVRLPFDVPDTMGDQETAGDGADRVPKQMSMESLLLPVNVPEHDRKTRILLVEDSPDNQAIVTAYLRHASVDLSIASNGLEACDKYVNGTFDLIFMDMQMPILDGYSATREIRRLEDELGRSRTPIVALTAHVLTDEIRKSLASGCDWHLAKPVRKQQLLDVVDVYSVKRIEQDRKFREHHGGLQCRENM